MERVALFATARKYKEPHLDLALLWGNLEVAQEGEFGGLSGGRGEGGGGWCEREVYA